MKHHLIKLAVIFSFVIIPAVVAFADPPDAPPPDPGGVGGGTPVGAPIDGGLSILFAFGAGYGSWKLYKIKNQDVQKTLPE